MCVQKCQGQRESFQMSFKFTNWEVFNGDFDVKSRISKSLNFVLLKDILGSFLIVSEIINAIVLIWQILEMVPLTLFKTLQSLVILEFFSQILLCCVLNLIFKLKLVLLSHLHFNSFSFLCGFVFNILNLILLFTDVLIFFDILKFILLFLHLLLILLVYLFELERF